MIEKTKLSVTPNWLLLSAMCRPSLFVDCLGHGSSVSENRVKGHPHCLTTCDLHSSLIIFISTCWHNKHINRTLSLASLISRPPRRAVSGHFRSRGNRSRKRGAETSVFRSPAKVPHINVCKAYQSCITWGKISHNFTLGQKCTHIYRSAVVWESVETLI